MEAHIQSEEDLRRHEVGAAVRSSGEEYLIREHIPYRPFETIEAAIEAMLVGVIDCVVSNVPVLQFLNNIAYYKKLAISSWLLLKNNMDNPPGKEPPTGRHRPGTPLENHRT